MTLVLCNKYNIFFSRPSHRGVSFPLIYCLRYSKTLSKLDINRTNLWQISPYFESSHISLAFAASLAQPGTRKSEGPTCILEQGKVEVADLNLGKP